MGFSVQSVEYMLNSSVQPSDSRALGTNDANSHYWTRFKVKTDANGCTQLSLLMRTQTQDGQYPSGPYTAGAQLIVSTSSTPSSYYGSTKNINGTPEDPGQNAYWDFSGTVNVSMKPSTTYYVIVLPMWTDAAKFVRFVRETPTLTSTANWPHGTFSANIGTGSSGSVYRSASTAGAAAGTLSAGATVYDGDTLVFHCSALAGYSLATHTVNGTTRSDGYSWTANGGDVAIVTTATVKTYTLTISQGTGSTILVKKGSTTLHNGDTISHFDVLSISISANTGYNIGTHKVNTTDWTSGNWTVSGAVTVTSTATLKTYTLSISQGTGTTITVKKGSTTLQNGDTITHFDTLIITISANTGYNIATHKVNTTDWTSGSWTVSGAVSVVATATLKTYTLSISQGTGSTILVKKGSTTLHNGDTITHFDSLSISISANTGYNLGTHTVNGQNWSSGSWTVTGAVVVISTAALKNWPLSISAGTGTTITVSRNGTPLSSGDTIYYGDQLDVIFSANTGYTIATRKINNNNVSASVSYTVTGAYNSYVTVTATATLNTYKLRITTSPSGVVTTVVRTASPNNPSASIGQLGNNANIYYGDALTVTYSLAAGYTLEQATINSAPFTSGAQIAVPASNVAVVVTANAAGFVYIGGVPYTIWIGNGSTYDRYLAKIGNGSTYDDY